MIIGNNETPDTWFNLEALKTSKIKKNSAFTVSESDDLGEIVEEIFSLGAEKGLIIKERILPTQVIRRKTELFSDGNDVKSRHVFSLIDVAEKDKNANDVWKYGERIRLRDEDNIATWTFKQARKESENGQLDIHKITGRSVKNSKHDKDTRITGFSLMLPGGRSLYIPFLEVIRGTEYAGFLESEESREKHKSVRHQIENYGDQSVIGIPSRAMHDILVNGKMESTYVLHNVWLKNLSTDEEKLKLNPLVDLEVECDDPFAFYRSLHHRFKRDEDLICAHSVAAYILDKTYREQQTNDLPRIDGEIKSVMSSIRRSSGEEEIKALSEKLDELKRQKKILKKSPRFHNDFIFGYNPAKELHYFLNVLDRRVLKKVNGRTKELIECEKNILVHRFIDVLIDKKNDYKPTTVEEHKGNLVHYLDNPFNFSFDDLYKNEKLEKDISDLYGK